MVVVNRRRWAMWCQEFGHRLSDQSGPLLLVQKRKGRSNRLDITWMYITRFKTDCYFLLSVICDKLTNEIDPGYF